MVDFNERSQKIRGILDEIVLKNDDVKIMEGLVLLMRLVDNIVKKPTDTKYRTIKSSIPKI